MGKNNIPITIKIAGWMRLISLFFLIVAVVSPFFDLVKKINRGCVDDKLWECQMTGRPEQPCPIRCSGFQAMITRDLIFIFVAATLLVLLFYSRKEFFKLSQNGNK